MRELRIKLYNLLRWSEQFTKIDMLYLAKGGFWLTLAKFAAITSSFLTSIAFANLLPEATYGTYRYILSLLPIFALATLPGIDKSLTAAVSRGQEGVFLPAFLTKVRWGVIGCIGSLGLSSYYFYFGNSTLGISFLIAAVFVPLMEPLHIYVSYLNGKKEYALFTFFQAITAIAATVILSAMTFFSDNIFLILIAYFFTYTSLRAFFFWHTKQRITEVPYEDEHVTAFGKHASFMSILTVISTSLDKILIFHYAGAAQLAGYYLSIMPFKQMSGVLGILNTLAFPNFATNDAATLKKTLPRKMALLYIPLVGIVVLYWIIAPYAFQLMYPKYTAYVLLSQIFMLQLILFPQSFLHTALTALFKHKHLYVYTGIFALTRVALLLILVPMYGLYGALSALVATAIISSFVLFYLFFAHFK